MKELFSSRVDTVVLGLLDEVPHKQAAFSDYEMVTVVRRKAAEFDYFIELT